MAAKTKKKSAKNTQRLTKSVGQESTTVNQIKGALSVAVAQKKKELSRAEMDAWFVETLAHFIATVMVDPTQARFFERQLKKIA